MVFAACVALTFPANCHGQGYTITTVAGGGRHFVLGDGGQATSASLSQPNGLAFDAAGNLFISDEGYGNVRKITTAGIISTVAGAATLQCCSVIGLGDGGPAVGASLPVPKGIAFDSAGNLYIADFSNGRIRKVDASGTITTVAGGGHSNPDNGSPATQAIMAPTAVAVDSSGDIYVGDNETYQVRKVTPGGTITTITTGSPTALAVDSAGNLYIADNELDQVFKVTASGAISVVAGNGTNGYSGDGGPATSAALGAPNGLAVDSLGNLYIADTYNNVVRMVTPAGTISTIAGNGFEGYGGDNGPATSAELANPSAVTVASGGRIFIADSENGMVRMLTPVSAPSVLPGGIISAGAFGAFPSPAPGSWIEIYGNNLAPDSRSWTGADFNGVEAPTELDKTTVTIGGQPAFIDYISPTQIDAEVPSNVGAGSQPVVVNTPGGASAPVNLTVNQQAPGLLAPPSFKVGSKQYVVALFPDNVTFVLPPGAVSGLSSRRAQPGDIITVYGVGFGGVTPNIPAGQVVQQSNTLAAPFHLLFGQTEARLNYDGLAPDAIGLYQFNAVVPDVAASDAVPVTFTLAGQPGTQTLYIAVQN